jgi:dihydroorotate dehydrogenase
VQKVTELTAILNRVQEANTQRKPILLKLAPDLADEDFAAAINAAETLAQGLVISNTTISRDGLDSRWQNESGGLSGAPLKKRSVACVALARTITKHPIIGVGGIETAADVHERIQSGADLVQLYTAMVYNGPSIVKKILRDFHPQGLA